MDVRIRQLEPEALTPEEQARRDRQAAVAAAGENKPKMSKEDIKFMAIVMGGTLGVLSLVMGFFFAGLWFFVLRESAPFHVRASAFPVVAQLTLRSAAALDTARPGLGWSDSCRQGCESYESSI